MKTAEFEVQAATDLKALAAAAHGLPISQGVSQVKTNREIRIAELKARYNAGDFQVDERAVASKLVDWLFDSPLRESESGM